MKSLKISAIIAILAVSLVSSTISIAEAKKASTDDKLSPKSYGLKTSSNQAIKSADKSDATTKFKNLKTEEIRSIQKIMEEQKASMYVKKTYRM